MTQQLTDLARDLAEYVQGIRIANEPLISFKGPSAQKTALQNMRRQAAQLLRAIESGQSVSTISQVRKELEGAVETCGVLGVISAAEREHMLLTIDAMVGLIGEES